MRRALKPDGLLLAAVPGAGTLGELRESLLAAESELTGGANARVHPSPIFAITVPCCNAQASPCPLPTLRTSL
jgi:hypothetical protein